MCDQHTTNCGGLQPCKKYFFVVFTGAKIAIGRLRRGPGFGLVLDRIYPFSNAFLQVLAGPEG